MEDKKIISQVSDTIADMARDAAEITKKTLVDLQLAETIVDCFPCVVGRRVSINGVSYGLTLEIKMKKI